ncbi:MAG: ribokinase [Ruminococcaceae bacterium]|nr:ribokinase [Oscillospiraceae bacterium]
MSKKPKVLVVGSFVMDLIVTANRFPNAGETVFGDGFKTVPGGKGANQAVQAARLGADVTMVGKVGKDSFGDELIASAKESGVNTDYVFRADNAPSAIGNVQIQKNEEGTENRIIVVPGANLELTLEDVAFLKDVIGDFDIVILQHEIRSDVNCFVAKIAKEAGVKVMLNPAPYAPIPKELLACLTYISPNEHEAADIAGIVLESDNDIDTAVSKIKEMGVRNVLITLGKRGCAFCDGKSKVLSGSVDCGEVIDPTAAGDSFMGAFCTAVAMGVEIESALQFANCTAGITVTKMGAQTSLPYLKDVFAIMEKNGFNTKHFEILK